MLFHIQLVALSKPSTCLPVLENNVVVDFMNTFMTNANSTVSSRLPAYVCVCVCKRNCSIWSLGKRQRDGQTDGQTEAVAGWFLAFGFPLWRAHFIFFFFYLLRVCNICINYCTTNNNFFLICCPCPARLHFIFQK